MLTILLLVVAYLLGSIPFGLVVGKFIYKKDIRQFGSGNIGTTNAFRAFGTVGGILVFVCDMLKGAIPVLLAQGLDAGLHPLLFGGMAIVGHSYPLFLKFKGGKAVATSFGVVLAYHPVFALISIASFFVSLFITSMVSFSSIFAITFATIFSLFYQDWGLTLATVLVLILVVVRHKDNIKRIRQGTESKVPFGLNKSKKK
ncbi:glycerol-3-phosphate 1-O-acyltransferase PlsY [Aerococcaceae bacterium 50-4]